MLGDPTHSSPRGYRAIYSTPIDGQGHHGGTAIYVTSDIPCVPVHLHSALQAVTVKGFLDRLYSVCSIYLPPAAPVERLDLDALVHDLASPFLLLAILMVVILYGVMALPSLVVFYWLLLLRMKVLRF